MRPWRRGISSGIRPPLPSSTSRAGPVGRAAHSRRRGSCAGIVSAWPRRARSARPAKGAARRSGVSRRRAVASRRERFENLVHGTLSSPLGASNVRNHQGLLECIIRAGSSASNAMACSTASGRRRLSGPLPADLPISRAARVLASIPCWSITTFARAKESTSGSVTLSRRSGLDPTGSRPAPAVISITIEHKIMIVIGRSRSEDRRHAPSVGRRRRCGHEGSGTTITDDCLGVQQWPALLLAASCNWPSATVSRVRPHRCRRPPQPAGSPIPYG